MPMAAKCLIINNFTDAEELEAERKNKCYYPPLAIA